MSQKMLEPFSYNAKYSQNSSIKEHTWLWKPDRNSFCLTQRLILRLESSHHIPSKFGLF